MRLILTKKKKVQNSSALDTTWGSERGKELRDLGKTATVEQTFAHLLIRKNLGKGAPGDGKGEKKVAGSENTMVGRRGLVIMLWTEGLEGFPSNRTRGLLYQRAPPKGRVEGKGSRGQKKEFSYEKSLPLEGEVRKLTREKAGSEGIQRRDPP